MNSHPLSSYTYFFSEDILKTLQKMLQSNSKKSYIIVITLTTYSELFIIENEVCPAISIYYSSTIKIVEVFPSDLQATLLKLYF